MKHDSVRVPRKNYRQLLNRPLFHWILTSLSKGEQNGPTRAGP